MESGIVNIRGKEYKTVARRVSDFREQHKDWGISTEIINIDESVVVMKAIITDEQGRVIGTGFAEENRQASQINKTSALENCETSAIGRALAACGYAGSEYASANEVENAIQQQQPRKINRPKAQKYIKALEGYLEAEDGLGIREVNDELKDNEDMHRFVWDYFTTDQKSKAKSLLFATKDTNTDAA